MIVRLRTYVELLSLPTLLRGGWGLPRTVEEQTQQLEELKQLRTP